MKKKLFLGVILTTCIYMCTACGETNEHVAQGMQYVEENQYQDAVSSFEKAKDKGEDARQVYRGLGIAYMGLADYESAIEAFLEALGSSNGILDSMDYDINYYLAAAYYKNGQLKECESTYDSIIDLDSRDAIAYELRGKIRLEMGRYEEAMEDFDKAIALEEKDLVTNFTSVIATLNNIGPGLSMVGPTQNFAHFSDLSKWVFIFDMLAGRLELFPLLILFHPAIWHELIIKRVRRVRLHKYHNTI